MTIKTLCPCGTQSQPAEADRQFLQELQMMLEEGRAARKVLEAQLADETTARQAAEAGKQEAEKNAAAELSAAALAEAARQQLFESLKNQTHARRTLEAELAEVRKALKKETAARKVAEARHETAVMAAEDEQRLLMKQHQAHLQQLVDAQQQALHGSPAVLSPEAIGHWAPELWRAKEAASLDAIQLERQKHAPGALRGEIGSGRMVYSTSADRGQPPRPPPSVEATHTWADLRRRMERTRGMVACADATGGAPPADTATVQELWQKLRDGQHNSERRHSKNSDHGVPEYLMGRSKAVRGDLQPGAMSEAVGGLRRDSPAASQKGPATGQQSISPGSGGSVAHPSRLPEGTSPMPSSTQPGMDSFRIPRLTSQTSRPEAACASVASRSLGYPQSAAQQYKLLVGKGNEAHEPFIEPFIWRRSAKLDRESKTARSSHLSPELDNEYSTANKRIRLQGAYDPYWWDPRTTERLPPGGDQYYPSSTADKMYSALVNSSSRNTAQQK